MSLGVHYTIDPARRVVVMRGDVLPPLVEWYAMMDAILADPWFEPGFAFISDQRAVPAVTSRERLERQIEYGIRHAAELAGCRWALVVRDEPAPYGMGRMAEALALRAAVELRVFTDLDEAMSWVTQR